MNLRTIPIALVALVAALMALRSAAALAPSDSVLRSFRPWFPGHATMTADRAMTAVGLAAREGSSLPDEARSGLAELARKEPLREEPFLVAGAAAQLNGDEARSERLFVAARWRDPRAIAPRYFLADQYLRSGNIERGLVEMAMLARLEPRTAQPFVPAVAAYARTPGAVQRLRRFFEQAPDMRDPVLLALAKDASNAPLVLRLAPRIPLSGTPPYPEWQVAVVGSLIGAGQLAAAEQTWSALSGIQPKPIVVNPTFESQSPPLPFAWNYGSGSGGVAEVRDGGGLDLVYYGRESIELARQLLNLAPGRYRIASRVEGGAAGNMLQWKIACLDNRSVVLVPLATIAEFDLPRDCTGPTISLVGVPSDPAQTVERTVRSVSLEPVT